jgi:hypothetical protein
VGVVPKEEKIQQQQQQQRDQASACRIIAEESGTTANRQTPFGGLLSLSSLFLFVCLFVSRDELIPYA